MRTSAQIMVAMCGILGILGGCSTILGIEDPHPGDGSGDGGPLTDRLTLSLTDVRLAQLQRVRVRVTVVHLDGMMEDATDSTTLESDSPSVAASPGPGQVDGGLQDGTATITAKRSGARPVTMKVTVTTKQCQPVINEFQTGSAASSADEWVEIINPCTTAVDVTDWTLVYRGRTSTTDSTLMVTLSGALAPGEIKLFAGLDYAGPNDGKWTLTSGVMAQTDGGVALRMGAKDVGAIVDSVAYGAVLTTGYMFTEGTPAAGMVNGRPAARLPFDGRDDGDNSKDFTQVTTGTPRASNAP